MLPVIGLQSASDNLFGLTSLLGDGKMDERKMRGVFLSLTGLFTRQHVA
jgi:hypothetical protein